MAKQGLLGLSYRAYGRRVGLSHVRISRMVRTGQLRRAILPDGSLDAALADQERRRNVLPRINPKQLGQGRGMVRVPFNLGDRARSEQLLVSGQGTCEQCFSRFSRATSLATNPYRWCSRECESDFVERKTITQSQERQAGGS